MSIDVKEATERFRQKLYGDAIAYAETTGQLIDMDIDTDGNFQPPATDTTKLTADQIHYGMIYEILYPEAMAHKSIDI